MNNNKYLVTIYIPTYNRIKLLKRAIESVLAQTYTNIEVIVVDDCSTDGTKEFLHELSIHDQRVKFFLKERNGGACESRNIAIQNAQGVYITGLDDDDYFEKDRIQSFVDAWEKKSSNTVALSSLYAVKNKKSFFYGNRKFKSKIIKFDQIFLSNPVGNQVFTLTETLKKIGGFDENLKCWQDLECWLRILQLGNIEKVFNYTYVIDVSHDKPRIGNSQHEKYLKSQRYIAEKFKLSKRYERYLYIQTFNCNGANLNIKEYFNILIKYPSLTLCINSFFKIYRALK